MHTRLTTFNRATNQELRHRPITSQQSIARSVKPAFDAQRERTNSMRFVITTVEYEVAFVEKLAVGSLMLSTEAQQHASS